MASEHFLEPSHLPSSPRSWSEFRLYKRLIIVLELNTLEPILFHIHTHKDAWVLSRQGSCRKIDAVVFHTASVSMASS